MQNIRIKHAVVIDDPFEGKEADFGVKLRYPSRSPSPVNQKDDVDLRKIDFQETVFLDDSVKLVSTKNEAELKQAKVDADTRARKHVLEILDDLPEADIEPPKNVLFVCKLNQVT